MRILCLFALLVALLVPIAAETSEADDLLYDQVRIRLANDRTVGGDNIEVKVSDGVVELTGKVRTDKNKDRAEKLVKRVKGVKKVINRLQVSPI